MAAKLTLYQILAKAGIEANAVNYGIAKSLFQNSPYPTKQTVLSGFVVETDRLMEVSDYLKENFDSYKQKLEDDAAIAEYGSIEAKREHDEAVAKIMITSGYDFEGYRITKYSGYISGDDAIQINRGGVTGDDLTNGLVVIRRRALSELKDAAYDLGCNAVVGVDFDYITLEQESIQGQTHYYEPYLVCVTANGTAVTIEKE